MWWILCGVFNGRSASWPHPLEPCSVGHDVYCKITKGSTEFFLVASTIWACSLQYKNYNKKLTPSLQTMIVTKVAVSFNDWYKCTQSMLQYCRPHRPQMRKIPQQRSVSKWFLNNLFISRKPVVHLPPDDRWTAWYQRKLEKSDIKDIWSYNRVVYNDHKTWYKHFLMYITCFAQVHTIIFAKTRMLFFFLESAFDMNAQTCLLIHMQTYYIIFFERWTLNVLMGMIHYKIEMKNNNIVNDNISRSPNTNRRFGCGRKNRINRIPNINGPE